MSTWDDKPNDYEHALVVIERLHALNAELMGELRLIGNLECGALNPTAALARDIARAAYAKAMGEK